MATMLYAASTASGRHNGQHRRAWRTSARSLVLAGYVVVAVTIGVGFEQDLVTAAEREGVAVNALESSTPAQITQDHPVYALLTGLLLFVSRCS